MRQGGAPIWGAQWHPERPQFEWRASGSDFVNHSDEANLAMFAVALRLVREAKLSGRQFASKADEAKALIYRYSPTGSFDGGSYQAYYFGPSDY